MEGEITPIVAGALYQENITMNYIRVKSVWVDEDLKTKLQIFNPDEYNPTSNTVDLKEFIDRIGVTITRVNSDHEAWEYRNN